MSGVNNAIILSAVRTPIGRLLGALSTISAAKLGAAVVRAAVARAGVPDLEDIDEVLMGNVVSAGLGQNIARQCAILGGLPTSVGATTVNKVCGASLKAVIFAVQAIRAGDGQLFVVGGVESMSRAPYLLEGRVDPLRFGHAELKDALIVDGLWCAFEDWAMGNAAEFIADEYGVTRAAMDAYALSSHQKAIAAWESGKFDPEVLPIEVGGTQKEPLVVRRDETPRDEHFQSNLPGLFFTSMCAVQDFGPYFAFTVSVRASAKLIGSALKL